MPSPLFLLVLVTLMSLDLLAAEEPEKLLRQARQQIAAGKFDEAHVLLSQVLEQDASNAVAHYIRGRVNFQRGKMKESVKDFDRYT